MTQNHLSQHAKPPLGSEKSTVNTSINITTTVCGAGSGNNYTILNVTFCDLM